MSRASAIAPVFSMLMFLQLAPSTGEHFAPTLSTLDNWWRFFRPGNLSTGRESSSMDETEKSRGFKSRRGQNPDTRVPPGQHVTTDFPILSAGPTPQIEVVHWSLALQLGGGLLRVWSWDEFEALPQTTIKTDIH